MAWLKAGDIFDILKIKENRIFTKEIVEKKIKLMEFAGILNAKLIFYDCGHYIHHYKSDEMCKEIINFVNSLEKRIRK